MTYKVQNRQSIFDIALAATGSVESVVEIAQLNGLSLNGSLELNSLIILPNVINEDIVNYLNNKGIIPIGDAITLSRNGLLYDGNGDAIGDDLENEIV